MKKIFLIVCLMIFSISIPMAVSAKSAAKKMSDTPAVVTKTAEKLSADQVDLMTKRVEAISDMDKSGMTASEKRVLRKEVKAIKMDLARDGGYVYIGAGTLILIILLLIILL